MSPIQNFEQHSRQLVEPDITIQMRLTRATEVRDSLEIAHTAAYLNFLKCYFPAFSVILLQMTKPQFTANHEHKLRIAVVEILNRLPQSEVLRPFVQELLKLALQVLTTDNEENGLICIHIILGLLKNFRLTLENEVQPFLDFVCKIYQNFRQTVSHFFENAATVPAPAHPGVGMMGSLDDVKASDASDQLAPPGSSSLTVVSSGYPGNTQLNPSKRSFKIVTESHLVVMFLFQLYTSLAQTNIPHLLPLMISAISVPGPETVPPHLRTHFIELKGAQVKTVSFLTYLLKNFADYMKPHEESICNSIENLLVTCADFVSIRKELLVALKHVLGPDFKRGLFPLIDTLLEERVGTERMETQSRTSVAVVEENSSSEQRTEKRTKKRKNSEGIVEPVETSKAVKRQVLTRVPVEFVICFPPLVYDGVDRELWLLKDDAIGTPLVHGVWEGKKVNTPLRDWKLNRLQSSEIKEIKALEKEIQPVWRPLIKKKKKSNQWFKMIEHEIFTHAGKLPWSPVRYVRLGAQLYEMFKCDQIQKFLAVSTSEQYKQESKVIKTNPNLVGLPGVDVISILETFFKETCNIIAYPILKCKKSKLHDDIWLFNELVLRLDIIEDLPMSPRCGVDVIPRIDNQIKQLRGGPEDGEYVYFSRI